MNWHDLDDFTQGYIDCALSSTAESTESRGYALDDKRQGFKL